MMGNQSFDLMRMRFIVSPGPVLLYSKNFIGILSLVLVGEIRVHVAARCLPFRRYPFLAIKNIVIKTFNWH